MSVKLSPEDQGRVQQLIDAGRFDDVEDVIHAGLDALEEDEHWRQYARNCIQCGVDDAAAGRTISGEEFIERLRNSRLKQA